MSTHRDEYNQHPLPKIPTDCDESYEESKWRSERYDSNGEAPRQFHKPMRREGGYISTPEVDNVYSPGPDNKRMQPLPHRQVYDQTHTSTPSHHPTASPPPSYESLHHLGTSSSSSSNDSFKEGFGPDYRKILDNPMVYDGIDYVESQQYNVTDTYEAYAWGTCVLDEESGQKSEGRVSFDLEVFTTKHEDTEADEREHYKKKERKSRVRFLL